MKSDPTHHFPLAEQALFHRSIAELRVFFNGFDRISWKKLKKDYPRFAQLPGLRQRLGL